jgi:glucosamine--fructose-6-phosphate aminotransferase (isomerizing)
MCGIVGFVQRKTSDLGAKLVDRLSALEYRGYDSAGVTVPYKDRMRVMKSVGDLSKLREKLRNQKLEAATGMAHTRWATHGAPSERNALPISTNDGSVVIVFNGIIENHFTLRGILTSEGKTFNTDNDAETLLLWIIRHYEGDIGEAVRKALATVKGRYAFAVMHANHEGVMIAAKRNSPLVIGRGSSGYTVASDVLAIHGDIDDVHYLADESVATIHSDRIVIVSNNGTMIAPKFLPVPRGEFTALKPEYETFTLQEIFAQPETITCGLLAAIDCKDQLRSIAQKIDRVTFVACGTAYYSGVIGKSLVERFAKIPADTNIASEFHIASPVINERTLTVFVSQSGETADTVACLELAKSRGSTVVVLCNVPTSTMARQADIILPINCGPEIGVASTKAYTGMLIHLTFMAIALGLGRDVASEDVWNQHETAARCLPKYISQVLNTRDSIERLARSMRERRNFAFMGRDVFYPTACEGALKLRELSYRNAEGFSGGELKHGTLALIEPGYPVIAVAPRIPSTEKMIGNIQEVKSRGAKVIGIISEGDVELASLCDESFRIPATLPAFLPILAVIPLQMFAYEIARTLGRNIDRPRNLAKSVTVE